MKRGRSSSYDMPDNMALGGMAHPNESVGHMHGMVMGEVPVGAAGDVSSGNAVEYPPSSTEPFGEAETRALIRIRHQLDELFLSTTKKRGVKDIYVQVAERLYTEGGGEVSIIRVSRGTGLTSLLFHTYWMQWIVLGR
jgi:hypothetical protein